MSLNTNTSSLINIAARKLSSKLQEKLIINNLNISIEQWRLLYYLWDKDGINQLELATIANKEKSTITRQIAELEKKEFIIRIAGNIDKRNKLIYVTKKGKLIKEKALSLANQITKDCEKRINKDELKIFKKVLNEIIEYTD